MSNSQKFISLKACFALLFYLIIPSIAIILIMNSYPELSKNRFYTIIQWILPTAVVIVFLAQCSLFYQKGNFKRYLLNIGFVIATMVWVYGLLGGDVVVANQWNEFQFNIHMTKYVTLILFVAAINIIYYTLEWRFYSKEHTSAYQNTKEKYNPQSINPTDPEFS